MSCPAVGEAALPAGNLSAALFHRRRPLIA